jgi:hypothetical protein
VSILTLAEPWLILAGVAVWAAICPPLALLFGVVVRRRDEQVPHDRSGIDPPVL